MAENYVKNDASEDFVIEMRHITKEFPGIIANDDITLQLRRGEIHALLGENGAGKSTLMSGVFGFFLAQKGVVRLVSARKRRNSEKRTSRQNQ